MVKGEGGERESKAEVNWLFGGRPNESDRHALAPPGVRMPTPNDHDP